MPCFSNRLMAIPLGLALTACGSSPATDAGGGGTSADGGGGSASGAGATSGEGASDAGGSPSHGGGAPATGGGGAGTGGASAGTCEGLSAGAGDFDRTISVGGNDRRFLLHVPASYDPTQPTRLIIAMHGFTENPEAMRDTSHLNEVSEDHGFLVAYPEGTSGSWNGGTCCGVAMFSGQDDVAFISAVIDAVSADYCVDPDRVHATGFSNGGFMSHRLGCELSDRIRSIGVVAGQESLPDCSPSRPVPVLQIHGDADPVVPMGGDPFLGFPSTASTITGWAQRDSCSMDPVPTEQIGDTSCEQYTPCDGSAAVELCIVSGGGHDWPGGGTAWTDAGPPDGFVATLKIVDFFETH